MNASEPVPLGDRITAAARRKLAAGTTASAALVRQRAGEALEAYRGVRFEAVVFDLDGTIADANLPRDDVRAALARLSGAGLRLGIATGRAPTERALALLRALFEARDWERVLIGYRNGAQLGRLDSDEVETLTPLAADDFAALREHLVGRVPALGHEVVLVADTAAQLTLRSANLGEVPQPQRLLAAVQDAIAATRAHAKAAQSPHHVDIVHPATSKRRIATILGGDERPVLRLGDTGRWPGNDFELLADPHGLSVDEVSPDLAGCWNFLPAGLRAVDGTLHYLEQLDLTGAGTVSFGARFFA